MLDPQEILDRTETCQKLGISRQTLLSWIRKGKLKVWKRVGTGSNSALLFARTEVESLIRTPLAEAGTNGNGNGNGLGHGQTAEPTAA
jgi:hypothetical protein